MKPELSFLSLSVPTYFLVLSLVFSFMVFAVMKRAKALNISVSKALDLYLFILIGGFLGARVFYIFYQDFSYFLDHPLEVFYFWQGGFVFYGGFLGGVFSLCLFTKLKKENLFLWLNFSAPLLALGYGLGRVACFLNGCCFGHKTDVWWSVYMLEAYRHPAQLYALVWELVLFGFLISFEKFKGFFSHPPIFSIWMIGHGLGRVFMEWFRNDDRGALVYGFSISTCISFILISLGLSLMFFDLRPFYKNKL